MFLIDLEIMKERIEKENVLMQTAIQLLVIVEFLMVLIDLEMMKKRIKYEEALMQTKVF